MGTAFSDTAPKYYFHTVGIQVSLKEVCSLSRTGKTARVSNYEYLISTILQSTISQSFCK